MTAYTTSRQLHRWVAIATLLPLALMIATGIVLVVSSQVPWLQPPTIKAAAPGLELSFDRIFEIAKSRPEAEIRTWADVAQIDARPTAGVVRVRSKNLWEVQIDGRTGEVLSVAKRWKTFFITLHDGSFFGEGVKYGVFLPAALGALALSISGAVIFFYPLFKRGLKRGLKRGRRQQKGDNHDGIQIRARSRVSSC